MSVLMGPESDPTLEQAVALLSRLVPGEATIGTIKAGLTELKRLNWPCAQKVLADLYQEGGTSPHSGILQAVLTYRGGAL